MVLAFVTDASYHVVTVHYEIVSHLPHRMQLRVIVLTKALSLYFST